jgi:hypothetical protein
MSNTKDTEVKISYHKDQNSEEITYETIGIINSGKTGADGTSKYFHIAYASDANGSDYNQTSGDYVSTYVDDIKDDKCV